MTAFGGVGDVNVALQGWENRLRQAAGNFWAAQQRRRGVGPVRVAVIGGDGVITVFKTKRLSIGVRIGVDRRVELAQEMLRLETLTEMCREVSQKTRLRCRQVENNCCCISVSTVILHHRQ